LLLRYNKKTMETISPALGVIIMINNYFHDVATGLLLASGVAIYVIMKRYEDIERQQGAESRGATEYFLRIYTIMTKLARFSFWWIIVAGIPRTYYYRSFEWAIAADKYQVPAIILKHVLAFAFVGAGIYMWHQFGRKVKMVRHSLDQRAG